MVLPADRSTDTHRVVAINPHDPVHQAIVSNPGGSNVLVKNGYLHFPKPGVRGPEESPAVKPVEKPVEKPAAKPVEKPVTAPKPAAKAPKKAPSKPAEVKKTGMAALADKNKARELADARRNAALKAKKLGK